MIKKQKIWQMLKVSVSTTFVIYISLCLILQLYDEHLNSSKNRAEDWLIVIASSVLEMPYFDKAYTVKQPDHINTLSYNQWMNIKCPIQDQDKTDIVNGANDEVTELSTEQRWHLNCLSFKVPNKQDQCSSKRKYSRRGSRRGTNDPSCNLSDSQCLNISVKSYILDYPEILQNLLKIAERPCDYVKEFNTRDLDIKDLKFQVGIDTEQARKSLCDNNFVTYFFKSQKKLVQISILDINNKRIGKFLVRRRDID